MKTTDFITENQFIGDDAHAMHQDHEVQMARSDCYSAAKYAIDLHKLLKNIDETQGLDGWVSEKITLANDYLRAVAEYLTHEMAHPADAMPEMFTAESAEVKFAELLGEQGVAEDAFQTQQLIQRHADMLGRSAAQKMWSEMEFQIKDMSSQSGLSETTSSAGVATTPGVGKGPETGTLFGGSYAPRTPFTGKKKTKTSVIKR